MEPFHYRDGQLYCEEIPVAEIAEKYGTPLYVYSRNAILGTLDALKTAFAEVDPLICYAVKANSNLGILKVMAERGSGFDVVSAGELYRVLQAGVSPEKTVFTGVGKTNEEIQAGLEAGVLMFNVETEAELEAITRVAASIGKVAPIAIRVNPDVDPKTHRYISTGKKEPKFGMDIARAEQATETAKTISSIRMIGMHMHIGSQITTTEPYAGAVAKGVELIGRLRRLGYPIAWCNMGGGYGINYKGREARAVEEFARVIVPGIKTVKCRLAIEPRRVIAGNAGILVSRVVYTKQSGEKRFLIQDAAMNDLICPVLYESFYRIWPVVFPRGYRRLPMTLRPRSRGPSLGTSSGQSARAATFSPRTAFYRDSIAVRFSPSSPPAPTTWLWPPTPTPVHTHARDSYRRLSRPPGSPPRNL
jgi:diaminopimelate decarboxylase